MPQLKAMLFERMYHSSKTISTLSTGNTGSDPSSKSRLPTSLRSSLFLQKTTKTFPLFNGQGEEEREISLRVQSAWNTAAAFVLLSSCSKEGKKFEKAKTKHTKTQGKTNFAYYNIYIYIYIYMRHCLDINLDFFFSTRESKNSQITFIFQYMKDHTPIVTFDRIMAFH